MKDFELWIAAVAPDWQADLAKDLAESFAELDQLIAGYMLKMHIPSEFSDKSDAIEAALRGSWDDQLNSGVIDDMIGEFYERRKHGEADTLIRQLRKLASQTNSDQPPMEGVA